jgi:hypothetical protein
MLEGMAKTQWNVIGLSIDHFIIIKTPASESGHYNCCNISLGNC